MIASLRQCRSSVRSAVLFSVAGCMLCVTFANSAAAGDLAQPLPAATEMVKIPGPLRSFLRMAGISQQVQPQDVLPLLARNSYLLGYNISTQTEFLRLLNRYLHQARELEVLAGPGEQIHISNCNDAATLLRVLGYRLRQPCGQPGLSLETANPTRAFLTTDSGFPLTDLEEALQKNTSFDYAYPTRSVPILFHESDWMSLNADHRGAYGGLLDLITNDPQVARLYWAMTKQDAETSSTLLRTAGLKNLLRSAATLDFYGSQIAIRDGHLRVPGAAKAGQSWKDLVGASPDSPSDFVLHLLAKDDGWLAAFYDAVARSNQAQQDYLTQSPRLKNLYEAFRSPGTNSPAAFGVFPKVPDLVILFTRLDAGQAGDIRVPGDLNVWKQILQQKADSKPAREWAARAQGWTRPEQLVEALTASARDETDAGVLQVYLMTSEIDRLRTPQNRLTPATVRLLADRFTAFSNWYLVFTEFPTLGNDSIVRFVNAADSIDKISDLALRGNAMGDFQANLGLWQILARQGEIPPSQLDSSWRSLVEPFTKISTPIQLFDEARASLNALTSAATGNANSSQEEIISLLAGPQQHTSETQQVHAELAGRMQNVLSDQRLTSLDTLFALSDGLTQIIQGHPASEHLLALAEELRDFELPRQIFTKGEKVSWAPRDSTGHHAELQARIDLTGVISKPATRGQLETARSKLSPLLRDALVGLNYAYYEPPNAQILHINPLFVRSHDFVGTSVTGSQHLWQSPMLMGSGISAGGGAYLMGSLSDLPYSLATAEQNMIAPENVQALIWKELAPELLADAVLERWWTVTPNELHAVALYQQFGEDLIRASASNAELKTNVLGILSDTLDQHRLRLVETAMNGSSDSVATLRSLMPADSFFLGVEFQKRFPGQLASLGQTAHELEDLCQRAPSDVTWERLSRDFGVPHPTLAHSYARELLNGKPFPFYGAYSSRLFGERWESGNLYWARLADQMKLPPVMLNRLVPELTRHMVAKIFASDLEDWPAVLRAMQETGEEFQQGKITLASPANVTALLATPSPRESAGAP